MKMNLKNLKFNLPDNPFGLDADKLRDLTTDLKSITKRAGTENEKFKIASEKLLQAIKDKKRIEQILINKIDIRALGFAIIGEYKDEIKITSAILDCIDKIVVKPSSLFIENFFQYYLNKYNNIVEIKFISEWLVQARKKRNQNQWYDESLLSSNGAKWVAELAITQQKDFHQVIHELNLDQFQYGQFMESAQRIYYVEQLKEIPVNQPHELLKEVQKPEVYKSKFDESELLGHKILKILIERAPSERIDESWLNVIMAIAGDPRIPRGHIRYITWWVYIDAHDISKVRGWLSRLDLKLFLEALKDFSNASRDPEMKRMYPSRKRFLEGLYDRKLIKNTRLYLSKEMAYFLTRNYQSEHLPDFSVVLYSDKSIIYVDLGDAHIIEGSHTCYLWIYKSLHESAIVFDYGKRQESYSELTSGLDLKMCDKGFGSIANITHNPSQFNWQRTAIKTLKSLNVPITMKDVLTPDDYSIYVRRFGVN